MSVDPEDATLAAKRKHRRALDELQEAIRQTEGNHERAHLRVARAAQRERKARDEQERTREDPRGA